jgi:uncharacterized membrane protein YphA (DoxX/SURF4 family)
MKTNSLSNLLLSAAMAGMLAGPAATRAPFPARRSGAGTPGRPPLTDATTFFASLGVPFPAFNAAFVGTIETVGGLFLLAGLASRYVTIPLIIILLVAFATDDHEALMSIFSDPDEFISATPFLFLLTSVLVFAFGPGAFSRDAAIRKGWQRGGSYRSIVDSRSTIHNREVPGQAKHLTSYAWPRLCPLRISSAAPPAPAAGGRSARS